MTDTNPFWDFSVDLYAAPGMARVCIELQDKHDVDVNVLLFCIWRASLGHGLAPADIAAVDEAVATWQRQVVQPLRELRRSLKGMVGIEPTRDRLKSAELEAERAQQAQMWQLAATGAEQAAQASATALATNLAALAGYLDLPGNVFEPCRELVLTFSPESWQGASRG